MEICNLSVNQICTINRLRRFWFTHRFRNTDRQGPKTSLNGSTDASQITLTSMCPKPKWMVLGWRLLKTSESSLTTESPGANHVPFVTKKNKNVYGTILSNKLRNQMRSGFKNLTRIQGNSRTKFDSEDQRTIRIIFLRCTCLRKCKPHRHKNATVCRTVRSGTIAQQCTKWSAIQAMLMWNLSLLCCANAKVHIVYRFTPEPNCN